MKLSQFPVNTTIESDEHGWYAKDSENIWTPMMACCSSCTEDYSIKNDEIDEKMGEDWHVRSVPWGVAWQLAIQLQDEYGIVDSEGEDITINGLINAAIDEHNRDIDREKL